MGDVGQLVYSALAGRRRNPGDGVPVALLRPESRACGDFAICSERQFAMTTAFSWDSCLQHPLKRDAAIWLEDSLIALVDLVVTGSGIALAPFTMRLVGCQ